MSVPAADLIVVGHYDQPSGYATRRAAGAPSWLLMWTQAGEGLVEQAGVTLRARPGDLVVLGPGEPHHYRVAPGARRWRFWWVHFQPRPSWPGWLAPYVRGPGCHLVAGVPGAVHDRVDGAFRRALRDARWLPPTRYTPRPPTADLPETPAPAENNRRLGNPTPPRDASPSPGPPAATPLITGEAPDVPSPARDASPIPGPPAATPFLTGEARDGPGPVRDAASESGPPGAMPLITGEASDGTVGEAYGAPAVVAGAGAARELVMGAVEEVLVVATASARPAEEGGDGRVRRALAMIAAEPGAPHTVGSLARAVALSPSRFAHLFAAETGRTPMRAVREARLRHAATLLEATDLDVGQVASASGFVSPFHFSRAFRQEHGLPPRAYRARARR